MAWGGPIHMTTNAHRLMAWFSPNYPIGAFSYSHGLEYAIHAGDVTDKARLQAWVSDVITQGSGRNDAILLAQAYKADPSHLPNLAELAEALCASKERFIETTAQGAAFAKITGAVADTNLAAMPLPIVIGAAAARHGMKLSEVLPLFLHSVAANLITVGVRFVPLGQTDGQHILAALFDTFEQVAREASSADLTDLGSGCFLSDMAAMQHETMTTRMFRT